MTDYVAGSIWSVLGIADARAVILAGPFPAAPDVREYLVAPLYSIRDQGFEWTADDVRLEPQETGLDEVVFAAIWNARPILENDLVFYLGTLPVEVREVTQDVYWASLNERTLGKSPRLGRRIRSMKEAVTQFQAQELDRWNRLSGRTFWEPEEISVTVHGTLADASCMLDGDPEYFWEHVVLQGDKLIGTRPVFDLRNDVARLDVAFSLAGINVSSQLTITAPVLFPVNRIITYPTITITPGPVDCPDPPENWQQAA